MKKANVVASALLGMTAMTALGGAHAAVVSYKEGSRPTVPGTTDIGRIFSPFDLTDKLTDSTLSDGDAVELFGNIVGGTDPYTIDAETGFSVRLTDQLDPNGFRPETSGSNTAEFTLDGETETLTTPTAAPTTLFSAGPGTHEFSVDGSGNQAWYDVRITADTASVPAPGTSLLLLSGLVGAGFASRRRQ